MTVCKRVYYSGRVQGVGFRYTTQRVARGYAVNGYVRNLPDGAVELVAEGPADHVTAFLEAVAQRMNDYIADTRVEDVDCGNYQDFSIRR